MSPPETGEKPTDATNGKHALRVLVVENDASSRALLARVLRLHDCNADTAIGAQQALSLLLEQRYDLLVTDLRMEPADGVELLRRVAGMEEPLRPRASIVLSGYLNDYYDKLRSIDLPLEFFQKPIHLPSLVSILDRLRREGGGHG